MPQSYDAEVSEARVKFDQQVKDIQQKLVELQT